MSVFYSATAGPYDYALGVFVPTPEPGSPEAVRAAEEHQRYADHASSDLGAPPLPRREIEERYSLESSTSPASVGPLPVGRGRSTSAGRTWHKDESWS